MKSTLAAIPYRNWCVLVFGCLGISIGTVGSQLTDDIVWIKFFDNVHWTSGTFCAAVLAWLGYQQATTPEIASVRRWFALGFTGYAIGQLTWDIQTFLGYNEFPSPSDLFYLSLGPLQLTALIKEISATRQQSVYKVIFLDTLALSTAALTLVLVLYLPRRGDLDVWSLLILIIYPVSLLMITSTMLMMIPSLRLRITFNLMVFVLTSLLTAWSWMRWNLLALTGTTIDGDLLNVSFSIAILLKGFTVGFRELEESKNPKWDELCEGFLRFLPLFNVLLACVAVIIVSTHNFDVDLESSLTTAGALIVIILAMVRQAVLLKEREELLMTQALLHTVIDTVPIRVFWKNRKCRYLGSNKIFAQDAGLNSPEELINKTDTELSWHEQATLYQKDDQEVMTSQQAKLNYQEPLTNAEGNLIWLRTSKVPLKNREGEVIGVLGVYDDITLLKAYQDRLMLMGKIFANTQESIMITNAKHEIIDVNEAFSKITGYSKEEVLGKKPHILRSGYHDKNFYRAMWKIINDTGHWSGELWNRKKNGEIFPEWITISAITDDNDNITNYVGIFSDISLLKQQEKQLEHIAHYDGLTGVPNRMLLADRMKQAIAQTNRNKKFLAVCYLDLDGFKPINDFYGHHIGDQVLIQISERITHTIREDDTLARLGGDEFVILLLGLKQINDCFYSIERLLDNIAHPISIENHLLKVTASIGVTVYPTDNQDPDVLLRHADQAMYRAKQSGKNRYFLYDTNADEQNYKQQQILEEIAQGLENNQFQLFYQPKVNMTTRKVIGAEALIRWFHPQKGLLSPALFLPAIENTELELKLGDWVINQALTQIEQWQQAGHDIPVSVNISGQQLLDSQFIDKLKLIFAKHPNVPQHLLEFEILETTALEIERSCRVIMTARSQFGISFALDDFGTGYSTLTYLKQLPVSTLKVDQSFVRDMLEDIGDKAIVEGVIALAKVFERDTVAEGVETEQHFALLRDIGCHIAQGYGIAKPMPAETFYDWYLHNLQCTHDTD